MNKYARRGVGTSCMVHKGPGPGLGTANLIISSNSNVDGGLSLAAGVGMGTAQDVNKSCRRRG